MLTEVQGVQVYIYITNWKYKRLFNAAACSTLIVTKQCLQKNKTVVSQLINKMCGMQVVKASPGWSTADEGIKVPCGENPEL